MPKSTASNQPSPSPSGSGLRVAITGATGMIGTALGAHLRSTGHTVVRVVRRNPTGGDVLWDPAAGTIDAAKLEGVDAIVHLAGEGIAESKWTDTHKKAVLDSRVSGTTLLAKTIASLDRKPAVWASGSAIGFYGDRGDQEMTESSTAGTGFLADVVKAWEASTAAADGSGVRIAHLRTGVVLSTTGGALKQQLLPFKLGLGGRFGPGTQYLPWITIQDTVRAILHVITTTSLTGPVNLVGPNPATNAEFTKALGHAVHRPTLVPTPLLPVKILYGADMVKEMLLASNRVVPTKLLASGFSFEHAELGAALKMLLDSHS
jgi:uncharacterized protein